MCVWLGLLLSLTSCAADGPRAVPQPIATLPPPRLERTSRPSAQVNFPLATTAESAPAALTATPFPAGLLEQARSVYGKRLIEWIRIPAIGVRAPVTPVGWSVTQNPGGPDQADWASPGAQVGWVVSSALPGDLEGNIILYGHNNIESSVFRQLYKLGNGDEIDLETGEGEYRYQTAEAHILPVLEQEADARAYAEFLRPSRAPRLTLVSCWPPTGNTHRVIVVAYPVIP